MGFFLWKKPILAAMKKFSKSVLYIVLFLAIIIAVIFFGSKPLITKLVAEKIETTRINDIYKIEFKTAYFNIFQMGITIKQIKFTPDSSSKCIDFFKYQKYIAVASIKKLNINYIDVIKFIKDNKISIENIVIKDPIVQLHKNDAFIPPKKKKKVEDSSIDIKEIQLNSIKINNLELDVFFDNDKVIDLVLGDIDLELIKPLIDLDQIKTPIKAISVDDIKFSINNIKYTDSKGLYNTSLKSLKYFHSEKSITLYDFKLKPLFSKAKFAQKFKYQSNRFDISIKEIELKHIDFEKLISSRVIAIQQVVFDKFLFSAYRNKNYPINLNKYPKLPQEALRSIKQKFEIDEIIIKSSDVLYTETAKDAKKAGKIEFKDLEIKIKDIGNTKAWQKNKRLIADAQTKVAGKGKLNLNFDFPLKSNTFYIKGNLGSMKMSAFNTITEPNANLKISKGIIEKMDFFAKFNSKSSTGKMNLYYHDLDFSIFKENSKSGKKRKRKLLNFVAKSFVIADANPNQKGEFHKAVMAFERDKNKGLFAYIWQTIFSGFKDTVRRKKKK